MGIFIVGITMGKKRSKSYKTRRKSGLKSAFLNGTVVKKRNEETFKKIEKAIQGDKEALAVKKAPKNAFLHPTDPDAIFPKACTAQDKDLRSEKMAEYQIGLLDAGIVSVQNKRKYVT